MYSVTFLITKLENSYIVFSAHTVVFWYVGVSYLQCGGIREIELP